jgi:hypothetical protein
VLFFRSKKEVPPSKAVNPPIVSDKLRKQLDDAWAVIRAERSSRRDLENRVKNLERARTSEAVAATRAKQKEEKVIQSNGLPPIEAGKPYPLEMLRKK